MTLISSDEQTAVKIRTPAFRELIESFKKELKLDPDNWVPLSYKVEHTAHEKYYIKSFHRQLRWEWKRLLGAYIAPDCIHRPYFRRIVGADPCILRRLGPADITNALVDYHRIRGTKDGGKSHAYRD